MLAITLLALFFALSVTLNEQMKSGVYQSACVLSEDHLGHIVRNLIDY